MQNTRLNGLSQRVLEQLRLWLDNPWRRFSLIIIALLFGNFGSTVVATTAGQTADIDVLVSIILIILTELTSWLVYSSRRLPTEPPRSPRQRPIGIELLNAVKIGFIYGLFVEALKLGS